MKDININAVSVRFGDKTVLDGFSAVFPAGSRTCLMGASGCGKTTLLNVLLGFIKPDGGTVSGVPDKTACVFQEDRLCEDFTALANVRLVCAGNTPRESAAECLTALGLGDSLYRPVRELSGGMKRRVAIARALCAESELLLLDEAFKELDGDTRDAAIRFARDRSAGKTLISVTHSSDEAALLGADTVEM